MFTDIDKQRDTRYPAMSKQACSLGHTEYRAKEQGGLMSRILTVDDSNARGLRRLIFWQAKRQYGIVPGIYRLVLPILRVGIPISRLYDYLHLRKDSPMTRLQREMLATVVNGAIGGAP
jgi:hypothetical protein